MTRTMLRDGYPTCSQFSAALRACRHAAAVELVELRRSPNIRATVRRIEGRRSMGTLAWRCADAPKWAVGVLCAALGMNPQWAPPVAPGKRERLAVRLLERIEERNERLRYASCGEQDAAEPWDQFDAQLSHYLRHYNVCREGT